MPLAIGSDSHVTRDWREELRWLEYGQRLRAAPAQRRRRAATGAAVDGRRACSSRALRRRGAPRAIAAWGLVPGARADLLVVDTQDAGAARRAAPTLLDALVFSSPGRPWRDVMVAGRWVSGLPPAAVHAAFAAAMRDLWQG